MLRLPLLALFVLSAVAPAAARAQSGDRPAVRAGWELVLGVECFDPDPSGIVSFSKARDAGMGSEDHVKLVFDTHSSGGPPALAS